METDKQLYVVFRSQPQWLFLLLGEPFEGSGCFQSLTLKAIERRVDGVWIPESIQEPIVVVEFQGYDDDQIYLRLVQEMAMLQSPHPKRPVRGIIFFLSSRFDPETAPWNRVVESINLDEAIDRLRQELPNHPLVAVFEPLFSPSEEILEETAAACYTCISESGLDAQAIDALQTVFISWLMKRLSDYGLQEIQDMLLGKLPELQNTKAGQELIAIGMQRGLAEGIEKGIEQGIDEGLRKGELIGVIRTCEMALGKEQSTEESLTLQSMDALLSLADHWKSLLKQRLS